MNLTTILSNAIFIFLINKEPEYPWHRYIYNSISQFEDVLPILIKDHPDIDIIINTHDKTIQLKPYYSDHEADLKIIFTIGDFTFYVYID